MNRRMTGSESMRFVGFGQGQCDGEIVCGEDDPVPQLPSARVQWQDFRFYGDVPGVGLVRGTLNSNRQSMVTLRALTPNGLFPADFLNELFITLKVVGRPFVRYRNRVPFQMHAPSTPSAPPPTSLIAHQVRKQDVFERVLPVPLAPRRVLLRHGVQEFLTPGGLRIESIIARRDRFQFAIESLLSQTTTVAYFVHVADAVKQARRSDGVVSLAAGERKEVSIDLSKAMDGVDGDIVICAAVLSPLGVDGSDGLVVAGPI